MSDKAARASGIQATRRRVRLPMPRRHAATPHALLADADAAAHERRAAELHAAGFRVSIARTAFEAIVKASCYVPDLILIGSLGDMDVQETVRLLTTCPTTSHIPVVQVPHGRRVPQRTLSLLRRAAV